MNKKAFLAALEEGISSLPQEERAERLAFYEEMIDDGMEEGLSETEAVAAIGAVPSIVARILADTPSSIPSAEPKKRLGTWPLVLLILGSPVWVALLAAAFAVALSLAAALWSVVVALWAVFASLAGCAVGGVAGGIMLAVRDSALTGLALAGAGLFCGGLSVFAFWGSREATKGSAWLTKTAAVGLVRCFRRKETAV